MTRPSPWSLALAAALLGATAAPPLRAQEIQVPIDSAGRIQIITNEMARRLGLFSEVEAFREARLFQLPDGSFLLEISSSPKGGFRRERRPLSAEQAAELRNDVTTRIAARDPTAVLDQSGRTKLLVGSMILGLGFYGPATVAAINPEDEQTAVGLYMLTSAGTFIVPFLVTRTHAVSDPVASLALWGATRGPIHGLVGSELGDADKDETKLSWSVAIGAAEAIAGGVAAKSLDMTSGRADLTGVGGDIGLGVGFAVANQLKLDQRYKSFTVSYPGQPSYTYQLPDRTLQSLSMLAGSGLGLLGGYALGGTEEWTRGDATIFRNLTTVGALTGIAVGDIIQQPRVITQTDSLSRQTYSYVEDDFSRNHTAGALVGAAAGVVLGRRLVTGRNFTTSQGTFLTLAPLAGALVGLGLAYVATPDQQYNYYDPNQPYQNPSDHSELYLTASALGAAAGFAVLYPAMARQAKGAPVTSDFQLSLNPLAAAQLLGGGPGGHGRVPLASVRYRF